MKFDLDTAWKDTMGLLTRNLGLLAVVAGVFFFLPYAGLPSRCPKWANSNRLRPRATSR